MPHMILWLTLTVVSDPTTYVAPTLGYVSSMQDWKTSQPAFRLGYCERNLAFTVGPSMPAVNHQTCGVPVSEKVGRALIVRYSLYTLGEMALLNAGNRLAERKLSAAFSTHRKLVRYSAFAARIAAASAVSYVSSAAHFRQVGVNRTLY